jgi:hypothetical protein
VFFIPGTFLGMEMVSTLLSETKEYSFAGKGQLSAFQDQLSTCFVSVPWCGTREPLGERDHST